MGYVKMVNYISCFDNKQLQLVFCMRVKINVRVCWTKLQFN